MNHQISTVSGAKALAAIQEDLRQTPPGDEASIADAARARRRRRRIQVQAARVAVEVKLRDGAHGERVIGGQRASEIEPVEITAALSKPRRTRAAVRGDQCGEFGVIVSGEQCFRGGEKVRFTQNDGGV